MNNTIHVYVFVMDRYTDTVKESTSYRSSRLIYR